MSAVDLLFLGPVIFAALYSVAAFACAARYGRSRPSRSNCSPPVTILKPLRGNDGQLYENLASFCRQDYRCFEIVFGVRDRHDPAIAVVNRLIRDFPDLELKLVIDDRTIGTNLKVSNLANLVRRANHDILIAVDSDMRVGPNYIHAVVGPLEEPRVGLVTCLYRGVAPSGVASTLGAMFINEWFFPAALVGTHVEPLHHAFGATIACRRQTLGAIGGFEALADYLADDYMLGRHLRWVDTWLVPVRDVLSFFVVIVSFLGRTVRWNDAELRVLPDGRLERATETANREPLGRSAAPAPFASEWEESA